MTLPATIRAVVDAQAITRVTRLFNGTLADVLGELLQNARRAGATRVDVETFHHDDGTILIVRDDGRGIDDPAALLALGRSGWDDTIVASEDPAGMGVFSLAGRHIEVRSRVRGEPAGWRVVIPAHAWECGTPLPFEPCSLPFGTEFRIALPETWTRNVAGDVKTAALHYPLAVSIDGVPCERRDFLDRAVAVEEIGGCRIGVFDSRLADESRLNFHGLQVRCRLPIVGEIDDPLRWSARIDVIDAPGLKLVLPARKEVVENEATAALREMAEAAIYLAIGRQPAHRLPFTGWCRARDLGIVLPPADASLPVRAPATADDDVRLFPTMVQGEPMLIVPRLVPELAQAARHALRSCFAGTSRLVEAQRAFVGYPWYDGLLRIDGVAVFIHVGGIVHRFDDEEDTPAGLVSGSVDDLQLDFTVIPGARDTFAPVGGQDETEPHRHRLTIDALVFDPEGGGQIEEARVLVRRGADIAPDRLADQITDALFHADDDAESDSAGTQRDRFGREARAVAIGLLQGAEAAHLDRIRSAFEDDIRWLIPAGRTIAITAGSDALSIDWAPAAVCRRLIRPMPSMISSQRGTLMRHFRTCVCSTLHLPLDERRFIEHLIAESRAGQSLIEHTDLTVVPHHDGYMIHVGVVRDHADRPANVPPALWRLLKLAIDEDAVWLSFDIEELPTFDLPVYPDDPPPDAGCSGVAVRCRACGSRDVMRDAWACWNEASQTWTLGSVFDAAFCNACEADTTLIETPLEAPGREHVA